MTDGTGRGSYSAGPLPLTSCCRCLSVAYSAYAAYLLGINPHNPIKYDEFDHSHILTTYLEGL